MTRLSEASDCGKRSDKDKLAYLDLIDCLQGGHLPGWQALRQGCVQPSTRGWLHSLSQLSHSTPAAAVFYNTTLGLKKQQRFNAFENAALEVAVELTRLNLFAFNCNRFDVLIVLQHEKYQWILININIKSMPSRIPFQSNPILNLVATTSRIIAKQ